MVAGRHSDRKMPRSTETRLQQAEREIARLKLLTGLLACGLFVALGGVLVPDAARDFALVVLIALIAVFGVTGFIRLLMGGLGRWDSRRSQDAPRDS